MEKEYYTINEVTKMLGRNRVTVYSRMSIIGIKGHKFQGDRKTYLSADEVERVKNVFDKPWMAPEKEESLV
jgi:hypothetical protein